MKMKQILLSILAVVMLAGTAYAAPSVKVSGTRVTISESMTEEGFAEIKAAAQKAESVSARKIVDADLEKIVATFPNLKELDVEGTKEMSTIAPIAKLANLKKLEVKAPSVGDFSPLASMTGLETLIANSDAMTDVKWMTNLTNLKRVKILGGSKLTSLEGLPALPSLTTIGIYNAAPADLSPLLAMPGLKSVELNGCKIADLTPLTQLPELDDLSLYGSTVKDFSPLAGCAKLKKLMYYATKDADFSTLGKLTQVTELRGGLTKLNDISWLENLPNLKKFDVFAEYVKDYSPLAKTNIEKFQIWSMREPVGDLAVIGQAKSIKELKFWSVDGATNSKGLSGLTNLERFIMTSEYNKNSGEPFDCAAASGWEKVNTIEFSGTALVNVDSLASAKELKTIEFKKIKGEPVSLKFVGQLSKLDSLSLDECTIADFDAIAKSPSLRSLSITKVEGVTSLSSLTKLTTLQNLTVTKGAFPESAIMEIAGAGVKVRER